MIRTVFALLVFVLAAGLSLASSVRAESADAGPVTELALDAVDSSNRLQLPETIVEGDRPFTASSSLVVRSRDFSLRPIRRPADVLEVTPGLVVVQHAGGGKANQYYLRGFDSDHGTDLALSFDGVPINNVSHAHGQGYADVNFVIPEIVELLEVDKGPYFVKHDDFATSGAVNLVTRRAVAENSAKLSVGYARVVEVMDACRAAGIERIGIITTPEPAP